MYSKNKNREKIEIHEGLKPKTRLFHVKIYPRRRQTLSNPNSIPSKIRHLARITVNRAHPSFIPRKIDLPNNIPILIHPPFESPTFPTEGFHIRHSPRVEGQEVRRERGRPRECIEFEIDFPLIRVHTRD